MAALEPAGGESWTPLVDEGGPRRFCANADYDVCNWLTTAEGQDRLCVACRHNDTIPDISQAAHLTAWRDIELAKHRLFYSLLRWKLPLKTRAEDPVHGLMFEFLADPPDPSGPKVMTGHDDGVVTIALAEADSAEMEKRRARIGRALSQRCSAISGTRSGTIIGISWCATAASSSNAARYSVTIRRTTRPRSSATTSKARPPNWPERFVSAYADLASMGGFRRNLGALPAHRRHARDGERVWAQDRAGCLNGEGAHFAKLNFDPYSEGSIERIVDAWAPFVVAMNSVNRAMGRPYLYPFIIAPAVVEKLRFIHDLVRGAAHSAASAPGRKPLESALSR